MFKQADELEVMAEAARVSAAGHLAGMLGVRPGMNEAELQGIVESTFKREGASCPSFNSIVAGGDRAYVLHYESNDATLQDGELVMVDAGAEVLGYAGDISRTYPVGAAFTPAQRIAYELVLAAQEYAITLVQGTLLVLGVPPSMLLTIKLSEENGFGPWRQAAQLVVQAALAAELWHLIVR